MKPLFLRQLKAITGLKYQLSQERRNSVQNDPTVAKPSHIKELVDLSLKLGHKAIIIGLEDSADVPSTFTFLVVA